MEATGYPADNIRSMSFMKRKRNILLTFRRQNSVISKHLQERLINIPPLLLIRIIIRYRLYMPIVKLGLFRMWIMLIYFMATKKLHPISGFIITTNGVLSRSTILRLFNKDPKHLNRLDPYGNGVKAGLYVLSGF